MKAVYSCHQFMKSDLTFLNSSFNPAHILLPVTCLLRCFVAAQLTFVHSPNHSNTNLLCTNLAFPSLPPLSHSFVAASCFSVHFLCRSTVL